MHKKNVFATFLPALLLVKIKKLYNAGIVFTMKMNSDDKFNVVAAYKISELVYISDLKNLIGVDLSAWTAAFASSLLSDPPRVFNSRAPTLNMGRPGISSASSAIITTVRIYVSAAAKALPTTPARER